MPCCLWRASKRGPVQQICASIGYDDYIQHLQYAITPPINENMRYSITNNALLAIIVGLALFLTCTQSQSTTLGNCIEYSGGVCIRCDIQSHLFGEICYKNILGCTKYQAGNICIECDNSIFVLIQGSCNVNTGVTMTADLQATLYKYGGDTNPGDQYGESGFIPTTLETVQKWPTFLSVYTFMRVGQYSHYISRTANPIYSVHYYTKAANTTNSTALTYYYKILYHGSGGGLFLLIADVPPNLKVQVRALNVIASSNVIDYCVDYGTADSSCLRCGDQYHLENKICYANIGGCIKYTENICLECLDYYFLVENRCISDCLAVSDARSILYFSNNQNRSTFETYYGISVRSFYTVTVTTVTTITTTTTTTTTGGGALMLPSGTSSSGISGFGTSSGSGMGSSAGTSSSIGSGSTFGSSSGSSSGSTSGSTSFGLIAESGSISGMTSGSSTSSQQSSSSGSSSSSNRTIIGGFDESSIEMIPSASSVLILNSTNLTAGSSISSSKTIISSTTTTTTSSSSSIPSSSSSSFSSSSSSSSSSGSGAGAGSSTIDPNCNTFSNGICTVCSEFFYYNKSTKICTMVSPFCATYSKDNGECLTCFPGFGLDKGDCVVSSS